MPKSKRKTYVKQGTGDYLTCRLARDKFPNGVDLLSIRNRKEFYEKTGIRILEDTEFDQMSMSRKIEAILETIARIKEDEHSDEAPT